MNKSNRLDTILNRQKLRLFTDSTFMLAMTGIGAMMLSVLV